MKIAPNAEKAFAIVDGPAQPFQQAMESLTPLTQYAKELRDSGRNMEAVEAYDQALRLAPDAIELLNGRACALAMLGRFEDALAVFDRALEINPEYVVVIINRAKALRRAKRLADAILGFDKALTIAPESIPALVGMAGSLREAGSNDAAASYFERAYAMDSQQELLLGSWLDCKLAICDWRDLGKLIAEAERQIDRGVLVAGPFSMLGITDCPARQRQAAELYLRRLHSVATRLPPIPSDRGTEKIRIGYFSGDFHNHPVSFLTAGLFETHDRSRFELTAFVLGPSVRDEMRQRVELAFDEFIEVGQLGDQEIVEEARRRKLDIAVDLGGFTGSSRPGIFVMRVAPIQVGYLGYPGTMGNGVLDYLVADKAIVTEADHGQFAEKIVSLRSYQANDSQRRIADVTVARSAAGLPREGFVFCCFNDPRKILPAMFDRWIRILGKVEGSVLWLAGHRPEAAQNLRKEAERRGLNPDRLVFADRESRLEDHLARYRIADLFLDTLPYNAHTTASDALWAGLPVLTCRGASFQGMVAASLLQSIQLPELIAETADEYENLAMRLALEKGKLHDLRARLAENRLATLLFDTVTFTRNLEAAYVKMHQRCQSGLPPEHFSV
jgi:predicted O-linked N-acetylglucosamine transferase (SPINDLY family)